MMYAHKRIVTCANCKTGYLCMLGGLTPDDRLIYQWTVVKVQEARPSQPASGLVTSASQADVNQAAAQKKAEDVVIDQLKGKGITH